MKFTSIDLDVLPVFTETIEGECGARVSGAFGVHTTCGKKTLTTYWDADRQRVVWLCREHSNVPFASVAS